MQLIGSDITDLYRQRIMVSGTRMDWKGLPFREGLRCCLGLVATFSHGEKVKQDFCAHLAVDHGILSQWLNGIIVPIQSHYLLMLKVFPSLVTGTEPSSREGMKPGASRRDPEGKKLPEYFLRATERLGL